MSIKASTSVTIADISDGTDGTGIKSTVVEYQAGSSGTTAPTGPWSTTVPATSASAPYLWTRVTYTYTDGSTPKVVYSVGSTPEGIEIGGRNLLKDTKTFNNFSLNGWRIDGTEDGFNVAVSDAELPYGRSYDLGFRKAIEPLPNTTYTLSFWAKGDGLFQSYFYPNTCAKGVGSNGAVTTAVDGRLQFSATNEWKKYWVTWTTLSDVTGAKHIFIARREYDVNGHANTLSVYAPKLELGNKATDWTPAPEDVDEGINKAQTSANNAQTSANTAIDKANTAQSSADEANATLADWCYNNNKVYINGSKIYAGTVTATQIAAKAVTADKLSVSTLSAICADLGSVTAGAINIGNGKFVVDSSGNLTSQYIVATGGNIGCWTLGSDRMYDNSNSAGYVGVNKYGSGQAFWAGGTDLTGESAPFRVGHDGALVATNATISGNITASGGKIGCFNIDSDSMYTNYDTLTNTNNYSNLYLGSNGIGFGKSYLNSNGAIAINSFNGTGSAIEGNSMHFYNGEVAGVSIIGSMNTVETRNHSSTWIGALQGHAGINVMEAGVSGGFNTLARVKCTDGAWAIGAFNADNNFYILYGNENRLTNSDNGYDAGFQFNTGGHFRLYGTLYMTNNHYIRTTNARGTDVALIGWSSGDNIWIGDYNGNYADAVRIGAKQLTSAADNKASCGSSSYRWSKVYAASSTISTSDERDKDIIGGFDNRHKELFMKLKPITFRWKDKDIDTDIHFGLGAQTTENYALECGFRKNELAAIEHDYWEEPNPKDGRTDRYSMAYDEIHMLTIPVVQNHERRLDSTDSKIENLQTLLMEALDKIAAQEKLIEQLQTS